MANRNSTNPQSPKLATVTPARKSNKTRTSTRKISKREKDERFAMKMLRTVRKAPALMTHDQMENLERTIQADDGVARRMGLAVAAMPGGELIGKVEADRNAAVTFATIDECVTEYLHKLKGLTAVLEVAQTRLLIALATREDMADVIAEAKKSTVNARLNS